MVLPMALCRGDKSFKEICHLAGETSCPEGYCCRDSICQGSEFECPESAHDFDKATEDGKFFANCIRCPNTLSHSIDNEDNDDWNHGFTVLIIVVVIGVVAIVEEVAFGFIRKKKGKKYCSPLKC